MQLFKHTINGSRELLNGDRGHLHALRPVSHLRLGKVGNGSGPFTLELLLTNSLLSGSLLLLLNLTKANKESVGLAEYVNFMHV